MEQSGSLVLAQPKTQVALPAKNPSKVLPELAGAAASAGLALASAAVVLHLWNAHLNVPIPGNTDEMPLLMFVKNMQTTGWYEHTPALGAPFGQNLAGFPGVVGDTWNLLILKFLSMFLSPAATINVFYVLGFPAIAAIAYGCLRFLGVSRTFAPVLGAVYAILPYHFLRGVGHLLLSSYYAVPVGCILAVSILDGRLKLTGKRRWLPLPPLIAFAGAFLLAGTGIYYASFAIVLLLAAGVLASLAQRSWRPMVSGGILSGVIVGGLGLAALPYILHTPPPGSTSAVVGRVYWTSEYFGLKITDLLLPIGGHRIPAFAHLREMAGPSLIPGEGSETLGVIGVVGFLAVTLAALLPRTRRANGLAARLQPLGVLVIVAVLAGTVSGLNSLLAAVGFAQLRAWNRISVVIAFLALAGFGHLLDAARTRWRRGGLVVRKLAAAGVAGLVLSIAAFDQTTRWMVPDYASATATWVTDQSYFTQVESKLGKGTMVFDLPYVPFPENPPVVNMLDYNHLRGYFHSGLRWSYGGLKGEESDWQQIALQDGIGAALPKLAVAGFDAIYVNRTGYTDRGTRVEAQIVNVIGQVKPIVSLDGTLAVYDIRAYKRELLSASKRLPARESVLHPVRFNYGSGFYGLETNGSQQWHWAQESAALTAQNTSNREADIVLRGSIRVADQAATVRVRVAGHETLVRAVAGLVELDIPVTVPAGSTRIEFQTDSSKTPAPGDPRNLRMQFLSFQIDQPY